MKVRYGASSISFHQRRYGISAALDAGGSSGYYEIMSTRILHVCVVGTGDLSTRRIYPYLGPVGMRLAGACARHLDHAAEKCEVYGGNPYTDYREMIEKEVPDAVLGCVGPAVHADLAEFCLDRRIPVYTEKPPAESVARVLDLVQRSAETRTLWFTGFKKRYAACYRQAREWLTGFDPADLISFSFDYCSGKYGPGNLPGGAFLHDFCIHIIDLTSWLFGEAEAVSVFSKGEDAFAASLRMKSGMVGTLTMNDHRSFDIPTEECEITVAGGNAMTISNSSRRRVSRGGKPAEWREPITFLSKGDSGYDTGMLSEIEEFAELVREGWSGERSLENARASYRGMVLYEAIAESAVDAGVLVFPKYQSPDL